MGLMDDVLKAGVGALSSAANSSLGPQYQGINIKAVLKPEDGTSTAEEFTFQFNPTKIRFKKTLTVTGDVKEQGQDQPTMQWHTGQAWAIEIPDVLFDTYEEGTSVYDEYVSKLEKFVYVADEEHRPPLLQFSFGGLKAPDEYKVIMKSLDVTYEMFLGDGTPVRARTSISLQSVEPKKSQQDPQGSTTGNSPDHARLYTVRRGDTLPLIAQVAYSDPAEWRRIADYNNIDDPLGIEPGARLLLPPILK